jgi:hypothetical protein
MRQVHLWPRVVAGLGLAWGVATMPTPANAGYAFVGEILRGGPFCHRRRLRSVKNKLNGGKEMRHHHSVALAGRDRPGGNSRPSRRGSTDTREVCSGSGGRSECAAGRSVLLIRHQLRRPGDRKHLCRRPVQCQCRYLFGIQPDISRPGDRVYRAAGDHLGVGCGWRPDGHFGRDDHHLRR